MLRRPYGSIRGSVDRRVTLMAWLLSRAWCHRRGPRPAHTATPRRDVHRLPGPALDTPRHDRRGRLLLFTPDDAIDPSRAGPVLLNLFGPHSPYSPRPASRKSDDSGTGLTAFAAVRPPSARARNTGAGRCTMRTCCVGRCSGMSICSGGSSSGNPAMPPLGRYPRIPATCPGAKGLISAEM
jgi:hypothetical protein